MLPLLDATLTLVHLFIILFNLLGWIWPKTHKAHLICIILTAASWFLLGVWFGMGYCPITDWQWNIKQQLGEKDLPASFIKYYADKLTGMKISSSVINIVTGICFAIAALLSVYVNFIKKKRS